MLDIITVNCYYFCMEGKKYTISELCDLTGFSRRTIRYYIQEGLLDPPAGRGRGGFYFDSHLEQLMKIRALQDKGLKLAAIQELLKEGEKPLLVSPRELWIRYPITEGVEIHINRRLEEKMGRKIAEAVRVLKSILEPGGGENE